MAPMAMAMQGGDPYSNPDHPLFKLKKKREAEEAATKNENPDFDPWKAEAKTEPANQNQVPALPSTKGVIRAGPTRLLEFEESD